MLRGIDVDKQQFYGDNSWGTSWGLSGSFVIGYATMERLLSEQGDGTVSVPLSQPAPVPVPPSPAPVPVPGSADANDRALWLATDAWTGENHVGGNRTTARALTLWAQAKGLS
jgi:hypothetical protein